MRFELGVDGDGCGWKAQPRSVCSASVPTDCFGMERRFKVTWHPPPVSSMAGPFRGGRGYTVWYEGEYTYHVTLSDHKQAI